MFVATLVVVPPTLAGTPHSVGANKETVFQWQCHGGQTGKHSRKDRNILQAFLIVCTYVQWLMVTQQIIPNVQMNAKKYYEY
jgi:hypothetical protein